jgi:hypothetical protein
MIKNLVGYRMLRCLVKSFDLRCRWVSIEVLSEEVSFKVTACFVINN